MGNSVYQDTANRRWAGYGVPALCDMDGCNEEIDRGLGYKCENYYGITYIDADGNEVGEDDDWYDQVEAESAGCGLFFCEEHLQVYGDHTAHEKTTPKPDSDEWKQHQLTDPSWRSWRSENGIDEPPAAAEGERTDV